LLGVSQRLRASFHYNYCCCCCVHAVRAMCIKML